LLIEQFAILYTLVFASLLGFLQLSQLVVPVCLQGVSDQTVIGIDAHITDSRQLGFVARPLDLLLSQLIGFV